MAEENYNTRAAFLDKLAGPDCDASPEQLNLVARLIDYFAEHDLIRDGVALPLYEHDVCPAACQCWRPFARADYPPAEEATVSVPWVGADFLAHRVCAVAINLNNYGGLGAQWWVRRGDIHERLRRGKRTPFPYRVGQYLAATHASMMNRTTLSDPEPLECADALEASALLEAVLCAPRPERSRPSNAMWENCPPRYLFGQLEILAPKVVLAVGQTNVWQPVHELLAVEVTFDAPGLRRGVGRLAGDRVEVCSSTIPPGAAGSHR